MTTRARPRPSTTGANGKTRAPRHTNAAESRIAELEAELARQSDVAKRQAALFEIAELSGRVREMDEFYRGLHEILGQLMYAENIYIALVDEVRREINFAFYVDSVDTDWPDPRAWVPFGERASRGVTGYIVRTGKPFHASGARILELGASGTLEAIGELSADYLGVPLVADGQTIGVLAVQSYR